ncbi:MAG: SDR family oxidoreductase [Actinomycetota bacterium]|nr:SDR family oxidoreductase [Actinomycetota bacterium]
MSILSDFKLDGEKAIVTGASRGLGREVALGLAEAGADVAVVDKLLEAGKETTEMVKKLGRKSITLQADVTNEEDVKKMVEDVMSEFGKIDILVNNAGIVLWKAAEEMTYDEWKSVIDVNLNGVYLCSKWVGKEMIKRKKGSIINVSSMSAIIVNQPQKQANYNASKAAVSQLTKCLAYEWAPYNVRVNAVLPGYIGTPLLVEADEYYLNEWSNKAAQKRIPDPAELKGIFVFLASKAATYFCGSLIVADGGYILT